LTKRPRMHKRRWRTVRTNENPSCISARSGIGTRRTDRRQSAALLRRCLSRRAASYSQSRA
jgi:hypothetical protein